MDIFFASKPIHWFGKIFGSNSFSAYGSANSRHFKTDHKALLMMHLILAFVLCLSGLRNLYEQMSIIKNIFFKMVTFINLTIVYFLFLPMALIFSILKRNEMIKVWLKLEYFCRYFESQNCFINYNYLKKFCFLLIFITTPFPLMYQILEYVFFNGSNTGLMIIFFPSMALMSLETQFYFILCVIKIFGRYLNKIILESEVPVSEMNDFLKRNLKIHLELYELCKCLNRNLNFIIIRIIIAFFTTSVCAYQIERSETVKNFAVSLTYIGSLTWTLSHVVPVVLVASCCVIAASEVCF